MRPLISVMIPVFNSAEYMKEALASVLAQDIGPTEMEISVIDNCSTEDSPEVVVRAIAGDRVTFYRQAKNVGAIENFNTCIRRARGKWVHILHADDTVRPGFYARARQAITTHPQISIFACRHAFMDDDGTWLSLAEAQARSPQILDDAFVERQLAAQRLHFVSLIVSRSAYEELGGFRSMFQHCTDWDMWNRLIIHKQIFYDPAILACNRLSTGSGTSRMIVTGENVREERLCVRISSSHLPRGQAVRLYRKGMKAAAIRALHHMLQYWKKGDTVTAWHQFVQAFLCLTASASFGLISLFRSHEVLHNESLAVLSTDSYPQPSHS
jgi:glycosyltransferase involved in cell wall biosynthesis